MKELLFGMALGYLAFTENGHLLGNKAADVIMKNAKKTAEGYMEKLLGVKTEVKEDENHQEDRKND